MGTKGHISPKNTQTIDVNVEGGVSSKKFDPFDSRIVKNPTTNFDTLVHLLKAVFGTGILSMPFAFRQSGLFPGVLTTIIIGIISTHCAYILVKCAHILYYKVEKTTMSFPEVAEQALLIGPKPLRKYSNVGRHIVEITLFVAYFGTCSVFAVVAAKNYRSVVNWYFYDTESTSIEDGFSLRLMIICLLIPLVMLSWIPDLKHLVPISMVANISMITSVIIIFYWIFGHFANGTFDSSKFVYCPSTFQEFIDKFPKCFSIIIFAMESIGVIMPIENKMKTPQKFIGTFGVLNLGMTGITVMYVVIGVVGFMNDPNSTEDMIVLEISAKEPISHVLKVLVGTSVICTCRLLFSVCLEIAENWMKKFQAKKSTLMSYILRTIMMTTCVLLAFAVPAISPFMSLIGAFCFSIQGFILPVILETITVWNSGFGFCKWIAIKNIIIVVVAMFAIFYGSADAIPGIKEAIFGNE